MLGPRANSSAPDQRVRDARSAVAHVVGQPLGQPGRYAVAWQGVLRDVGDLVAQDDLAGQWRHLVVERRVHQHPDHRPVRPGRPQVTATWSLPAEVPIIGSSSRASDGSTTTAVPATWPSRTRHVAPGGLGRRHPARRAARRLGGRCTSTLPFRSTAPARGPTGRDLTAPVAPAATCGPRRKVASAVGQRGHRRPAAGTRRWRSPEATGTGLRPRRGDRTRASRTWNDSKGTPASEPLGAPSAARPRLLQLVAAIDAASRPRARRQRQRPTR